MKKKGNAEFVLAVILAFSLAIAGCAGDESESPPTSDPAGNAPNIPEAAVTASTDSPEWQRYLAYTRPPSETLILEDCTNPLSLPDIIDVAVEETVDNGYRSEYGSYYAYPRGGYPYPVYTFGENMLLSLDGAGEIGWNAQSGGGQSTSTPPERAVAEPDIYALSENLLYTLNTYRGLQAIRVASLDNPHYVNGVYLAGFPNEVYLKGDLVISTVAGFKPGYGWGTFGDTALPEGDFSSALEDFLESKVVAVSVANPEQMELLAEYPLEGTLIESRIVGDILYAVTYTANSMIVTSFSLANAPEVSEIDQASVTFPDTWDWELLAYTHLHVSTEYLFVSIPVNNDDYYARDTDIHIFDISDAGGAIAPRGIMTVEGRITDRFKLDLYEDTFRVVAGDWSGNNYLSIFDISDPDAPVLLATKAVGMFEQLFATRFDGNRAYIVTYMRTDPLWVLDLSDPANPMIVGELIVPGWSMYIEPLGDRLVALGVDDGEGGRRASVSLFSVEDPTNPRLLDRVTVGSQYSTSYGFADYKAFQVLSEENLILLPWSDYEGFWWWDFRMEDQVTLIDLNQDTLDERGSIAHIGTVERPFLSRDHAFILSQSALQIANIDDRDAPESLSLLRLLRSASQIVPAGDFAFVQDENEWWEVIDLRHPELKPTARVKIDGVNVQVFAGDDAAYVVRRPDNESGVEIHRLVLTENGEPVAAGCVAFPEGVNFTAETAIALPDSHVGLVGNFSQWDYYYPLLMEGVDGDVATLADSSIDWSYREGILLLSAPDSSDLDADGFIDLTEVISGGVPSYYAPYITAYSQSDSLVRGHHLYLPVFDINWDMERYSYPTDVTVTFYAGRLDLENPQFPSLLRVNIPGELVYVSTDEEKMYYLKTIMEETLHEFDDYTYSSYTSHSFLGACGYTPAGFSAGDEIALDGYNGIRFEEPYAAVLSGSSYSYYYYPDAVTPVINLYRVDDIVNLELQDFLDLPEVEAGYTLNGMANGRVFLSLGPFSNPKRIRESAISQGTWHPEGEELYAYLDLVYAVEDTQLSFEHLHPSTIWNPAPVEAGENRILVPAGMYGIEVLENE